MLIKWLLQQFYMEVDPRSKSNKKLRYRYRKNPELFLNQVRQQRFNIRYSITERKKNYEALADPHASYYFSTNSVRQHLKEVRKALKRQQYNQTSRKELKKLLTARINEKFSDHIKPNTLIYAQQLNDLQLETLNKKSSASLNKKSRKSIGSQLSQLSGENMTHHNFGKRKNHYFKQIKPLDSTPSQQISPDHATEYPKAIEEHSAQVKGTQKTRKKKGTSRVKDNFKYHRNNETTELSPECQKTIDSSQRMKTTSKDNKGNHHDKSNKLADELHRLKHQKWLKFLEEKKQLFSKQKDHNPESEAVADK